MGLQTAAKRGFQNGCEYNIEQLTTSSKPCVKFIAVN